MIPKRGEIWLFDCGMVEKIRPVLILTRIITDESFLRTFG